MKYFRVCLLMLLPLLAGCSGFEIINSLVPTSDYTRTSNLAYGNIPRQRLDVYQPLHSKAPAGIVIFIHGGSWSSGNKDEYRFIGEALASQGFIAVLPDYRLYPDVTFPLFVQDCAQAVRWTHDNAARFGGDPNHIYLLGHSAGAHIVALLTLDDRYLKAVGLDRSNIAATAGLAGPYDFQIGPRLGPIFNLKSTTQPIDPKIEPINCVDGHEPPMLLQQGTFDETVNPGNTKRLAEKIRQKGGQVKVILYPGIAHISIVLAMAAPFRWLAPVLHDTADFFRKH